MIVMTKKEWKETPKDYKSTIDGKKYVLVARNEGACLVPVVIIDNKKEKKAPYEIEGHLTVIPHRYEDKK